MIPIPSGGAASSLDLSDVRDQALARQAMKNWPKRWAGLSEEFKNRCAQQLKIAIDEADALAMTGPEGVADAAKIRLSVVKTAVAMEGQNQADEHMLHKTGDDGAERHKVEVVYVNKPRAVFDERTDNLALPGRREVVDGTAVQVTERSGSNDVSGASGGD